MIHNETNEGESDPRLAGAPMQTLPTVAEPSSGSWSSTCTDGDALIERRLAAIMSGDVVAYSRLIAEDEDATVRRLRACRALIGVLVERHRGRVVDFIGDNFLAEFASVVDAVGCALAIQRDIRAGHETLPPPRRMEFRLGLHLGEVRCEDGRLYGNCVNIAARLESLADPGGVCVSQAVAAEIANRVPVLCNDLGSRAVKNISKPVRAFRLHEGASGPKKSASTAYWARQRYGRQTTVLALLAILMAMSLRGSSTIATALQKFHGRLPSASAIVGLPSADLSARPGGRRPGERLAKQVAHALATVRLLGAADRDITTAARVQR